MIFHPDVQRRSELLLENRRVGQGEVWNQNACVADSFLQLRMHHSIVTAHVFPDLCPEWFWRRDACAAARNLLCTRRCQEHRPVQRDNTNSVVARASVEERAGCLCYNMIVMKLRFA